MSPDDYHPPAAAISRLETWSDSTSEEPTSFTPHPEVSTNFRFVTSKDSFILVSSYVLSSFATLRQSLGSNQIFPNKIYAQDPQRSIPQ